MTWSSSGNHDNHAETQLPLTPARDPCIGPLKGEVSGTVIAIQAHKTTVVASKRFLPPRVPPPFPRAFPRVGEEDPLAPHDGRRPAEVARGPYVTKTVLHGRDRGDKPPIVPKQEFGPLNVVTLGELVKCVEWP